MSSVAAMPSDVLAQLEHEQKICDGAQHILRAGGVSEALRQQVRAELAQAQTRMTALHRHLSSLSKTAAGQDQMAPTPSFHELEASRDSIKRQARALMLALQATFASTNGSGVGDGFATHSAFPTVSSLGIGAIINTTAPSPLRSPAFLVEAQTAAVSKPPYILVNKPMGPPITPSTTRHAHRARSAALAAQSSSGRPQHHRTPSHAQGLGGMAHRRIDLMARLTDVWDQSVRLRYECPVDLLLDCSLPCLSDAAGKEVRAASYRLLRHAIVRPPWMLVRACRRRGLDLFITRTFLRDTRFTIEKEQALKLIRWIMDCGCGHAGREAGEHIDDESGEEDTPDDLISTPVIRAMSAAIEHGDERLRILYIETLAELALHDVDLLIRSGGMRALLAAAADTSLEILPEVMAVLLSLADLPTSRSFFRPSYDLTSALAGFTDARDTAVNLDGTALAVSVLLRSWTGLLFMCFDDRAAVRSLVLALEVNPMRIQDKIIDVLKQFFDLGGRRSESGPTSNSARLAAEAGRPEGPRSYRVRDLDGPARFNLIDAYLTAVCVVLLDSGIVEALVRVIESRSPLTDKAMTLLQQLAKTSSARLPTVYVQKLHAMPGLFRARFAGEARGERASERERASSALQALDHFASRQSRQDGALVMRERADSSLSSARPAVVVDETSFRTLILEANISSSKEWSKWNVEALQTLFENVLVHPKRVEEVLRASKLVRRLLSFYHPFSMRYSTLPVSTSNIRFTRLGCTILRALTSSPDGARFLAEDRLLKELADCLDTDVMSDQRLQETMAGGYFELMAALTQSREGVSVMQQARLFTALFRVIDRRRRTNMTRAILRHFDFSVDGHCRVLLSRVLAHRSRSMRIKAMRVVATLINQHAADRDLVRLLVGQLYDPISEVRLLASDLLLQACTSSTSVLDVVVSMRPMLHEGSHSLLLRFLSTSQGVQFLLQGNYIDHEMDEWFNDRNMLYANQLEAMLAHAFNVRHDRGSDRVARWDGSVPPHFYGELVKTAEGCAVLERKGHFAEFARFIRHHATEEADVDILLKLKSILWATGNIGACRGGIPFLEAEELVGTIVRMSERTTVTSLRGTCYFVLGLVASTQLGAELLQDAGWLVSASNSLESDRPYGFCLPSTVFLTLPRWDAGPATALPRRMPAPSTTRLERSIARLLADLGNDIVSSRASRSLARLKERYPSAFCVSRHDLKRHFSRIPGPIGDPQKDAPKRGQNGTGKISRRMAAIGNFVRALYLLETQPLRLSVRRYVWQLFEVELDEETARLVSERRIQMMSSARTEDDVAATEEDAVYGDMDAEEDFGGDSAHDEDEGDDREDEGEGEEVDDGEAEGESVNETGREGAEEGEEDGVDEDDGPGPGPGPGPGQGLGGHYGGRKAVGRSDDAGDNWTSKERHLPPRRRLVGGF